MRLRQLKLEDEMTEVHGTVADGLYAYLSPFLQNPPFLLLRELCKEPVTSLRVRQGGSLDK